MNTDYPASDIHQDDFPQSEQIVPIKASSEAQPFAHSEELLSRQSGELAPTFDAHEDADTDPVDSSQTEPFCDPSPALMKLIDFAAKYPEIGATVAELAFKIGRPDLGKRVVRMGLDNDSGPGLEYYFVVANAARRQRKLPEVRARAVDAIKAFIDTSDDALDDDDAERLLHLVRLGYSTLLFDEKDPHADPQFVSDLNHWLPKLASRLDSNAFYHTLVAQTKWYESREQAEQAWDKAVTLDSTDASWNARGTWYKDAAKDIEKAENAYRKGLEACDASPLLLHNLAQLLVDKAENPKVDVESARKALREAEQFCKEALRQQSPKGFRRYVHGTIDRLMALRSSLPAKSSRVWSQQPAPELEPKVGEVVDAVVRSIVTFGAFVTLAERGTALLHKSEIAHHFVRDPSDLLRLGQTFAVKVIEVTKAGDKLRVAVSRKALIPAPELAEEPPPEGEYGRQPEVDGSQRKSQSYRQQSPQQHSASCSYKPRNNRKNDSLRSDTSRTRRSSTLSSAEKCQQDDRLASLGEMLLAKLNKK